MFLNPKYHHLDPAISDLPISHSLISCVPAPISYSLASLRYLPVGYSLIYPLPPKAWIDSSATSVAHFDVYQITLAQSRLDGSPLSTLLQAEQSIALEDCSLEYISAIFPCISWNSPMGLPNCFLSFMQLRVVSKAACMMPTGPAARISLSQSRPLISTYTPPSSFPRTFSSGTYTFQKTNSPVLEPLIPSLSSFWAMEKPFMFFSTRKAVMPFWLASGLVFAYTTRTSASGPLVIQNFVPLRMYLLPSFFALSFIDTTSEPDPVSDIAKAPICSPEHSFGRYFLFCSSLACLVIWATQRAVWAEQERPMEPEPLEISSRTRAWAVQLRPVPPYSSGVVIPKSPISPNSFQRWLGKSLSLSVLSARGATFSSTNLLTDWWSSCRSGERLAMR